MVFVQPAFVFSQSMVLGEGLIWPYLFAEAMVNNKPIKVFNYGDMVRDFTYVDDIIESIVRLINTSSPLSTDISADVFNIGNSSPHSLLDYISELESCLGLIGRKNLTTSSARRCLQTVSDCSSLYDFIGFNQNPHFSRNTVIRFLVQGI